MTTFGERVARTGIPNRYLAATTDLVLPPEKGRGLLLVGPPGVGKTHAACALGIDFLHAHRNRSVRFRTMFQILDDQRRVFSLSQAGHHEEALDLQADLELLAAIDLLIVDDVAKEHATGWSSAQFDGLLRSRFDRGQRSVVTTNLPVPQWAERYSEAMASFIHEAFEIVVMSGKDRRRAQPGAGP